MPKPYRIILTGRSALKAGAKRVWRNPECRLQIVDNWQANSADPIGAQRHAGLIYTVEVSAEHILESLKKAVLYARYITDQLAVVHGAMIDYPLPQFSIDIAQDVPDRELAQVFYNVPIIHEPRREYNLLSYEAFDSRLKELRQERPEDAQRIDRALHYLRSSFSEHDPIDQFEDAWVALEAINPLIRKKYAQGTTYQQHCSKCNGLLRCAQCNSAISAPDNASGIDYIIEKLLGCPQSVSKAVRGQRNDIVHARAKFTRVLGHLVGNIRVAQRAGVAGILDVLEFPQEQRATIQRAMLPIAAPPQAVVTCILYDLPVKTLAAQPVYPQLSLLAVERVIPNTPEAHAGAHRPMDAQFSVTVQNFGGRWELRREVHALVEVDAEAQPPTVLINASKISKRLTTPSDFETPQPRQIPTTPQVRDTLPDVPKAHRREKPRSGQALLRIIIGGSMTLAFIVGYEIGKCVTRKRLGLSERW